MRNNKWRLYLLRSKEFEPLKTLPSALNIDGDYRVSANVVLREEPLPSLNNRMMLGKTLGVVVKRTLVRLLEKPINDPKTGGYYAYVKVPE